ncbi:ATPase [Desulfurivibrio alkaliphilus]|uniref:Activator of 2-hydroxyglutaryl-CoA dehydratase (HSP70-class ATPase domain)-like protein n=1 Tax=Desulfurivibrio alkaliphilus (strain DSM 19089 / UNIQEM U267 / AHT2) TaxID=589865 RepID=D6Z3E6_DESAT|nr:ATPase [Desulfurivibrio alkaliphilus]ADH86071.1 Activator of 2-hydroxyglutaryl-CoA dehydratase (HSP70-class ATPase domain)-like protein [Desulfurivibrio alkaliphilus AHT 2]
MILGDFGTSYSKILDLGQAATQPRIIATRELPGDFRVDLATGHNARRFGHLQVNELTALARGGEALIGEADFLLLDCGSRDIKFVRYRQGKLADMGWNAECGASMGFTIELLERYYQLDCRTMPLPERSFPVTCGVLGLSEIFDAVVNGVPEAEAVARLIRGIARNSWRFAGEPDKIYLSGGLCENPVFVGSFPCPVVPLGRFVLLEGMRQKLGQAPAGQPSRASQASRTPEKIEGGVQ